MENSLPFNQIFSVTKITEIIKEILQSTFRVITIEGEISNFKPSSAGHIYFTLKDSASQISAVMFRGSAYHLNFRPKDGDKVRCTGNITVYGPQGRYQINVTSMEKAGGGDILAMLEERKQRLAKEGLFDENRKKTIPLFPKTVGVVTSPTGAAIRDILQITRTRNRSVNVIIFPSAVQGEEAAPAITKMIEIANFYSLCDVLIVGRGGGSLEDLLPFSEESVVRAVAASKIPVISAVGHEIDWALCDYAADKRAATPSQAAEIAVPKTADITQNINFYKTDLYQTISSKVESKKLLVKSFNPETLEIRFRSIQQPLLNRFDNARDALYENLLNKIKELKNQIAGCKTILQEASPQTIFARGYSMVTSAETGKIITDAAELKTGDKIQITPAKGKIQAQVL